ncbi:precorrin-8X methylmutase, partial [Amylibacter sp.]|nr:precorrin-8X methylmutase [Amylibacter sp.]
GFIGAAESKATLIASPRDCEFIALRGRRGGSAIASAAVNALSAGLPEISL